MTQILPFADTKAVKLYGQLEAGVYEAMKSATRHGRPAPCGAGAPGAVSFARSAPVYLPTIMSRSMALPIAAYPARFGWILSPGPPTLEPG